MADAMPLVKGRLGILVLRALCWSPTHGFEITSRLEGRSGGSRGAQDSALDPALHRLEPRGLAAAEWGVTANDRRARYYRITDAGRGHLVERTAQWVRYAETVTGILAAASDPA
ncbi:MAG TPA: helix-turn-helix transcriptional regulator [Gemmatimonadaceae bacterium]|nr:helix-turn-helix transcriptional regulator [Gemmatimonadaceae bacterium]